VFNGAGSSWAEDARLSAFVPQPQRHFGNAIALASDRMIVGEMHSDNAYVFDRYGIDWRVDGSHWSINTSFFGDTPTQSGTHFGGSVGISNTTAIIGAFSDADGGHAYIVRDSDVLFKNAFE
jgi:FG-GAP repeat